MNFTTPRLLREFNKDQASHECFLAESADFVQLAAEENGLLFATMLILRLHSRTVEREIYLEMLKLDCAFSFFY